MYELGVARSPTAAEQASYRLTSIAPRPRNLVDQLALAPRRLTSHIPPPKKGQGIVVIQRESAYEPATDAERVKISVLARNCWRKGLQITTDSLEPGLRRKVKDE